MSDLKPLQLDIVSDVVCPWCYIGKRRIEDALALAPEIPVEVRWRPFFLNPWVPREGISRDEYLTTKFGSPEAYKEIAQRVVEAATEEGLTYRPELREAPAEHDRLPPADPLGRCASASPRDEAAADGIVFPRRRRSHRRDVLVQAAADCGLDADDVRAPARHRRGCRTDFGVGRGSRRQGHFRRADFRVRVEICGVGRAATAANLARAIRQVSGEINAAAA